MHSEWWQSFFQGVAVDMWLQAVPAEQSAREADRLERLLAVSPGAELLDVPCGAGRVALPLAGRGYRLTGVDLSPEFLAHARARDTAQQVAWQQQDMRDLPWPDRFDGAVCVGNSFGYLDDGGNAAFLQSVRRALKPGGRFVLDTPMILENLLARLQPRVWWQAGDVYLLVENHYDPRQGRLEIEYTFVANGTIETRRGSHRAYTFRDMVELLTASGFAVESAEPWSREAPTVTFIATRTRS